MISPRRFAIMTAACGTVIAAVAGFSLAGIKNTHTPAIEERATTTGEAGSEAEFDRRSSGRDCRGRVAGRFADALARSTAAADRGGERA